MIEIEIAKGRKILCQITRGSKKNSHGGGGGGQAKYI